MPNLRKLKGLRVEHNLTQEEFASILGMPISTYRKKESGESPINLTEAHKIAKVFNLGIDEIFFSNNVPKMKQDL